MASVRRGPNAEAVVYFEMVLRTLAALTAPFPPAAAATASGVESSGRSSPAGGSIEAGLAVPGSAQPSSTARSYSNEANAAASTRRTTPPGRHAAERPGGGGWRPSPRATATQNPFPHPIFH